MNIDLAAALPHLAPLAIAWAEQHASKISFSGHPLSDTHLLLARKVGVASPEKIRLAFVQQLPLPDDPQLSQAAIQIGMLGPNMIGLTLGHSIYMCIGHQSDILLRHECRHVHQYELAGSIAAYLPEYLDQVVRFGYPNAPYEIDARNHEVDS